MLNYSALIPQLEKLCREVGAFQLASFRSQGFTVATKSGESDLVTSIDLDSDKMLSSGLKALLPTAGILSEESGLHQGGGNQRYQWIVDPLDGTNNYAQGIPIFSISIGLHLDDNAVLGVVFAPYLDEWYWAIKGQGAFCNAERLAVSKKTSLNTCILATGFPYDIASQEVNNLSYFTTLAPQVRGIRRFGSAAYDLSLVARGIFDGYWELNLQLWDIAAGTLLVEEAGGEVSYFRADRRYSLIAANPPLCRILRDILK